MERTKKHVEALIFGAEQPINVADIQSVLEESMGVKYETPFIQSLVVELQMYYAEADTPYEIIEIDEAYQFMTKIEFHHTLHTFLKQSAGKKLSNSALETLAIIAYKQPITKTEVESIRGVNCDYLTQKLLERELIQIVGREESPGRPLLYATSEKFMDHFGLKSIKDLPKLKEFQVPENSIGKQEIAQDN